MIDDLIWTIPWPGVVERRCGKCDLLLGYSHAGTSASTRQPAYLCPWCRGEVLGDCKRPLSSANGRRET